MNLNDGKEELNIQESVRRFGRDTLQYGVAVIIPALLGIFSIIIFTRLFNASQYGEYNLVLNTTLFITMLFSQWLQQSIQRYRSEYIDTPEIFKRNLIFLMFVELVIIAIIGLGLGPLRNFLGAYHRYYTISVILIGSQFLFLSIGAILQSSFKSKQYRNYNLLNGIFKFIFAIVIIYMVNKDPISIIVGLTLSQAVLIFPMIKSAGLHPKDLISIRLDEFWRFTKKFIFYGFPMIGWFLGTTVLNLCDRYMLQFFASSKDVGIYSANYSIVSAVLALLATPLTMAAQPIIMNQSNVTENTAKVEKIMTTFSGFFLLVSIPFLVYVTAFYQEISAFFLGKEFRVGAEIIPILFAGILFWNLAMYGHKGFELLNKTKLMLLLVSVSALLNLILNFILVPKYSYFGASIATLISMAAYPLLVFIIAKRDIIKWNIDWKQTIKIVIAAGISGFLTYQAKLLQVHFDNLLKLIIGAIIGFLIYGLLLIVTRTFDFKWLLKKRSKHEK
jgi:O-antigen/teichoic acid export membrane protein